MVGETGIAEGFFDRSMFLFVVVVVVVVVVVEEVKELCMLRFYKYLRKDDEKKQFTPGNSCDARNRKSTVGNEAAKDTLGGISETLVHAGGEMASRSPDESVSQLSKVKCLRCLEKSHVY